jgi:L-fuculose-phosphate aldolase
MNDSDKQLSVQLLQISQQLALSGLNKGTSGNASVRSNAVVHTHSMFATTLACLHREIPAFHYMIAVAGGVNIRCAPYALFGSQALSDVALIALQGRKACLLANHGMIALGRDLAEAFSIAVEMENLAEQYWRALQLGTPYILSDTEMRAVFAQFNGYGSWAIEP